MAYWVVGIFLVIAILYFLDREIYFYEATHLGPRIQSWLYDRWAAKYDKDKGESQKQDADMLARPILDSTSAVSTPLILDLATGTGRLPAALLREPAFRGHIVAVDVSAGMLNEAASKLAGYQGRFTLIHKIGYPLPFPDHSFDVVCCMEALEVMPDMNPPLAELHRVLRPGGLFLTSRATDASGRKAKVRSVESLKSLLQGKGFEQVEIISWWRWFDRVTARKPGDFLPADSKSFSNVLICPNCQKTAFKDSTCSNCGNKIPQSPSGILLM